jgi:hypothetical protein
MRAPKSNICCEAFFPHYRRRKPVLSRRQFRMRSLAGRGCPELRGNGRDFVAARHENQRNVARLADCGDGKTPSFMELRIQQGAVEPRGGPSQPNQSRSPPHSCSCLMHRRKRYPGIEGRSPPCNDSPKAFPDSFATDPCAVTNLWQRISGLDGSRRDDSRPSQHRIRSACSGRE